MTEDKADPVVCDVCQRRMAEIFEGGRSLCGPCWIEDSKSDPALPGWGPQESDRSTRDDTED